MLCAVKAVLGWLVVWFLGINLVGFVVRGLLFSADAPLGGSPIIVAEYGKLKRNNLIVTIFFIAVTAAYLYMLSRLWNIGVAVAAAMPMLGRLPDLLFEIKTGEKVSRANMPQGVLSNLGLVLDWAALPVMWWALCRM